MNETARRRFRGLLKVSFVIAGLALCYALLVAVALALFGYAIVLSGQGTISEAAWMPVPGTSEWPLLMSMGLPWWLVIPAVGLLSIFTYGLVRMSRRGPSKIATPEPLAEAEATIETEPRDSGNKLLRVLDLVILSWAVPLISTLLNISLVIVLFRFFAGTHVTISEVVWMPVPGTAGPAFGEQGLPLWLVLLLAAAVLVGIYGRIRARAKGERFISMAEGSLEEHAERRAVLRRIYADEVSAP